MHPTRAFRIRDTSFQSAVCVCVLCVCVCVSEGVSNVVLHLHRKVGTWLFRNTRWHCSSFTHSVWNCKLFEINFLVPPEALQTQPTKHCHTHNVQEISRTFWCCMPFCSSMLYNRNGNFIHAHGGVLSMHSATAWSTIMTAASPDEFSNCFVKWHFNFPWALNGGYFDSEDHWVEPTNWQLQWESTASNSNSITS